MVVRDFQRTYLGSDLPARQVASLLLILAAKAEEANDQALEQQLRDQAKTLSKSEECGPFFGADWSTTWNWKRGVWIDV